MDPAAHGVRHAPPPYAYRCPFGSTTPEAMRSAAAAHIGAMIDDAGPDTVAAVLMEPDAGTNGIVAPDTYWPALRAATPSRGVLLIADEVMSGFGRCGEWFAWQRYGDAGRPDIMTLAKGLTGAHLPLGAVVLSARGRGDARVRDDLHRAHLLRPSALVRRRCGGGAMRTRTSRSSNDPVGLARELLSAAASNCRRDTR